MAKSNFFLLQLTVFVLCLAVVYGMGHGSHAMVLSIAHNPWLYTKLSPTPPWWCGWKIYVIEIDEEKKKGKKE